MELGPDEETKQLALLTKVRQHHHNILVHSGVARRILDAKVPVNFMADTDPFTEGTLLYPTRRKLANMALEQTWGTNETITGSCSKLPQDFFEWKDFIKQNPDAHVIMLGRLDAHSHGWSNSKAFTNLQLELGETRNIIPLDAIDEDDASIVTELLYEVERLHLSGVLTCLQPEKLTNYVIGRIGPTPMP